MVGEVKAILSQVAEIARQGYFSDRMGSQYCEVYTSIVSPLHHHGVGFTRYNLPKACDALAEKLR